MSESRIQRICVFCGSRFGTDSAFTAAASALGKTIAERGFGLVYGGARVGLMGVIADAALAAGGHVTGVLPRSLVSKEIAHDGLSEMILTSSMHERKNRMLDLSDAFVSMPGGFGTYDEFFEMLTLTQIGVHAKPNALFDVGGFFDPLVALMKHTVAHDFAADEHLDLVIRESDPGRLLDAIVAFRPPPIRDRVLDRRGPP